jgi:hypothetical protein
MNQTIIDLNVDTICGYFCELNSDFPENYLYDPCTGQDEAETRQTILEALYMDDDLYVYAEKLTYKIKMLNKSINELHRERNLYQRHYLFLRIVSDYFDCDGLAGLSDVRAEAGRLLRAVTEMLGGTLLVIDRLTKTYSVANAAAKPQNKSERLKSAIQAVFGLNVTNQFSVVNPAPFGNMEEKALTEHRKQNPQVFEETARFYERYHPLLPEIETYSKLYTHLSFYITLVKFYRSLKPQNINICRPIFDESGFAAVNCYCPSLAVKYVTIVPNDIHLPKNSSFILSGANQGGKTIYLKTAGLTAYLAKCGCLVLAEGCRVPFYDRIHTHFMQKEIPGKGRLAEETERLEELLPYVTADSLLLLNESFASTRRRDGLGITLSYIERFRNIGCSVGFVSHYYEIPDKIPEIISLTSVVDGGGRTYKINRIPGTGMAYARDIAWKCGMTFEQIRDGLR